MEDIDEEDRERSHITAWFLTVAGFLVGTITIHIWAISSGNTGPLIIAGFILGLLFATFVAPAWAIYGLTKP